MIIPTVGRIVWFTPRVGLETQNFDHIDKTAPLAAIVTHVWGDRRVNLVVFDSAGCSFGKIDVRLLQDDDPKPEEGFFCSWMPYQIGQAKRHEEEDRTRNKSY